VCSCIGMRKSWQSRPRHAQQCNPHNQLMPCMSSVRSTQSAIDGAALDARVMARNVCRDLVFEASSHAACSHSDLGGCADGTAEALPARQTASIRCWHAPMQLSGLPRVFVHALAFSSTPSHADAAEFSSTPSHAAAAAHALCSFHHSPRVRQLSCSAAQRCSTAQGRHGHQTTPLKDLSNTRALKHLAPLATNYWAASHSFIEPGHSCFHLKFEQK